MRFARGTVGLVIAVGGIAACSVVSPSEIRVTNANSKPVDLIVYREGAAESAGVLLAGESKTLRLAPCPASMAAVESGSGRVVSVLDDACGRFWTISE
jgi:hypothetical protein